MSEEEIHRKRHQELHKSLDELLADFIAHAPGRQGLDNRIMDLIEWSFAQTKKPTHDREMGRAPTRVEVVTHVRGKAKR